MTGAAPVPGDDSTRTRLAEALVAAIPGDWYLRAYDRVDALLPVVEAIAAERAAEALDGMGHAFVADSKNLPGGSIYRQAAEDCFTEAASLRAASREEAGR